MLLFQSGQVLPGSLLYISLVSGLGVTATPVMSNFVNEAELVSISHARSALETSMNINRLLSRLNYGDSIEINGIDVSLKYGYPYANPNELKKMVDFGTQTVNNLSATKSVIRSKFDSYCFIYSEAITENGRIKPANVSEIEAAENTQCKR